MDGGNAKGLYGTILAISSVTLVRLGRCSRHGSRLGLPASLYLIRPCIRNFLHLTTMDGGNAKGLYGTILAM